MLRAFTDTIDDEVTIALLRGHEYRLSAEAVINWTSAGGSASPFTGSGGVTLTFTPEPQTGLLVSLGLVAMATRKRSKAMKTTADADGGFLVS